MSISACMDVRVLLSCMALACGALSCLLQGLQILGGRGAAEGKVLHGRLRD